MNSSPRVVVKTSVHADVDAHAAWLLDEGGIEVAIRFLAAAYMTMVWLGISPGAGRLRRFRARALANVRSWPVRGFATVLVFYRPIEGGVEILRVAHGAQDLDRILK